MDLFSSNETSSQSKTVTLAPPSPEEMELLSSQLAIAKSQLAALKDIGSFTADQFDRLLPTLTKQTATGQNNQTKITKQILKTIRNQLKDQSRLAKWERNAIKEGVNLTEDQDALITTAANTAIQAGLSDISAFRDESLKKLAQETAPARGLRPDDTPIVDVGGQIVNEAQRLASRHISGVRSNEAQARLEYPIQAGEFMARRTQAQQQIGFGNQQFAEQLRQSAFNNRLNLNALIGNQGLGLAQLGPHPSTLAGLQQLRLGSADVSGGSQSSAVDPMGLVGAAGGFMTGLGSLGFSDRRLKTDIKEIGRVGEHALYRYRYKGETQPRVGVMADEIPVRYVVDDPSGFKKVDYGLLLRAA